MKVYADTSFWASLYALDFNSPKAIERMGKIKESIFITPLGEIEFVNAMEQRVFRKELTWQEAQTSLKNFEADLRNDAIEMVSLPIEAFQKTKQLSKKYTAKLGCRTLDILHVASALSLRATEFLTFDLNQYKLAKAEGLKV